MALLLVDLAFAFCMLSTGALATWWLYCRGDRREKRLQQNAEQRLIRQVLADTCRLTAQIGMDVHNYSSHIREVDGKLASASGNDNRVATAAISTLSKLNGHMQCRLKDAEERLARQDQLLQRYSSEARTDPLTGLANRRALDEELAQHLAEFSRKGPAFSLVLVDIDCFKTINDRFGHPAGDNVLRQIARILEQAVRPIDIVTRYGGEEFILIFPGGLLADARSAADKVRRSIGEACLSVDEANLRVTVSAGVAQILPNETAENLVRRADEALLAAKKAGRNCVHWHDGQASYPEQSACDEAEPEAPAAQSGCPPDSRRLVPPPCILGDVLPSGEFHEMMVQRALEAKSTRQPLSVILAEVNQYATLVEQYGPRAGELALHCLVKLLRAASPEPRLVGHYGGACLATALPGVERHDAKLLAERVRAAVDGCKLPLENGPFQFSTALSVAQLESVDDELNLLSEVEAALAEAGKAVKSRVCAV